MSLVDHPIGQPSFDISPIWTPVIAAEFRKLHTTPSSVGVGVSGRSPDQATQLGHLSSVDCVGKLCFYVGTIQRNCLFSDDFYSDTTMILTIAVKWCMDIGARSHVCGVSFNACYNSRRWFMLCLVYISYLVLVVSRYLVWRQGRIPPRNSNPRMNALLRASSNCKWHTHPLVREDVI
jgi:hypothetical protein